VKVNLPIFNKAISKALGMGISSKLGDVCLMEFIGTFIITYTNHGTSQVPYSTLINGLAVYTSIVFTCKISGAQFNGAVTFLLFMQEGNKTTPVAIRHLQYFASQVFGNTLASQI
jgi:glycerol uptake facilitator-like aquaporin